MTDDPTLLWTSAARLLRGAMDDATYDLWVAPLTAEGFDGQTLTLAAPDAIRGWVESRLRRAVEDAVAAAAERPVAVLLVPATGASSGPERGSAQHSRVHIGTSEPPSGEPLPPDDGPGLNPKYTFEQFVIGSANRFAHAAALAAAELPGQAYNPLFLYGPPGVGKSHLLHAIGNYVAAHEPTMSVRYTTAEHFTNSFLQALRHGGVTTFKTRHRKVDLLLIDDVQFLERKARTEEEFFHTFNALREAGGQVVLTSDRLPRDLDDLEDRLRQRFEAGLVADLAAPDPAMRMTVLRKRALHDGLDVDSEALELIADRIPVSVRALEAGLIRTVAFASLTGRRLDVELAREVLDDLYPERVVAGGRVVVVQDVIVLVAESFSLSPDELCSSSREARIAWPRQLAMYLAREHTDQSLPAIARAFGARAHTTVLHACRRTAARLDEDPQALAVARELAGQLTARGGDRHG